uniref:TYW2 N-terminal domain-containing protein n=1 Tax=Sciurus vulgaris TaxID=55149 RepID=A0A8D2ATG6_SCIVU
CRSNVCIANNMEREGGKPVAVVAVVTEPQFTQRYREYLKKQKLLDRQHRVEKMPDGTVALPVLGETLPEQHLQELRTRVAPGSTCVLSQLRDPRPSKATQGCAPARRLCLEMSRWQVHGKPWKTQILHIQPVKSYAPHVDHIVLDLECRPCPIVG